MATSYVHLATGTRKVSSCGRCGFSVQRNGIALASKAGHACSAGNAATATLLVEGAEADDIAAFLTRKIVATPLPAANKSLAVARPVVLLTADSDWLQFMEHPSVHCVDLFGAVRRPEWQQVHPDVRLSMNWGTLRQRGELFSALRGAIRRVSAVWALAMPAAAADVPQVLSRVAAQGMTWRAVQVRSRLSASRYAACRALMEAARAARAFCLIARAVRAWPLPPRSRSLYDSLLRLQLSTPMPAWFKRA